MSELRDPQWVQYGSRHGWMVTGVVPATNLAGGDFWAQAARVACMAEGGRVDMVQCYDAGIMSAGPLGFTAATGTLAALLAEQPPDLLEQCLGDLFAEKSMGLRADKAMGIPVFTRGLHAMSKAELVDAFLGGSDGVTWTHEQQALAHKWAVSLQFLLERPASSRSTASATGKVLRTYLSNDAANLLAFTAGQPPSRTELRRAAACFLAYAVNNPRGALKLLNAAGPDADRMMAIAAHPGAWPETFSQRTGRTRTALTAEQW